MKGFKRVPKFVSAMVICSLVLTLPSVSHGQAANAGPSLFITILDGEGALNNIRQRTAREPIVEVQDENHKPVAGAFVLFSLPSSGPSGAFADGTQTLSTVTDSAGRAVGAGLKPNGVSGSYNIHVQVTYNGSTANADIHQKNSSGQSSVSQHGSRGLSAKTTLLIVAAAAAIAVTAVLATNGGSNSTLIIPGPPTVGPPTPGGAGIRIPLHGHAH